MNNKAMRALMTLAASALAAGIAMRVMRWLAGWRLAEDTAPNQHGAPLDRQEKGGSADGVSRLSESKTVQVKVDLKGDDKIASSRIFVANEHPRVKAQFTNWKDTIGATIPKEDTEVSVIYEVSAPEGTGFTLNLTTVQNGKEKKADPISQTTGEGDFFSDSLMVTLP
jgi:hypothetical protein